MNNFIGAIIVLIPAVAGFLLQNPVTAIIGIGISVVGLIVVAVLTSTCTAIFRWPLATKTIHKTAPLELPSKSILHHSFNCRKKV